MSRRKRNLWTGGVAISGAALALLLAPALMRGYDSGQSKSPGKLVMHEWGTFTSFAGSDGVNLDFRPLATNDLPRFVLTPFKQSGSSVFDISKDAFVARQRMETPVAYFYTDAPREVKVRVDFPQGQLTEWYPAVKRFESGLPNAQGGAAGKAFLDWDKVRLLPADDFAKVRVRGANNQPVPATLPNSPEKYHYGRARETDSAIVETVDANRGSHFEKFLFYRGLGNFELPIKLVARGGDRFEITNTDADASGALLLVRIEKESVRFTRLDPIDPHATSEVGLPAEGSTIEQLAEAMVRELVATGLYEKEALAMVNTWRSSWFGEDGTRLLYLLPAKLTEDLLPLTIQPAPDENVRVLVGRLETITPEDCQRLIRALVGTGARSAPSDEQIEAKLQSLGRFAEPAIQFVISQTGDPSTRQQLEAIAGKLRRGK